MEFKLLIKKAQKSDKDALLQLIMAQQADYYKLAYLYMKNKDDALDVLQDMIVTLYQNISKLKKRNPFIAGARTILVNCCKNNYATKTKHSSRTGDRRSYRWGLY